MRFSQSSGCGERPPGGQAPAQTQSLADFVREAGGLEEAGGFVPADALAEGALAAGFLPGLAAIVPPERRNPKCPVKYVVTVSHELARRIAERGEQAR